MHKIFLFVVFILAQQTMFGQEILVGAATRIITPNPLLPVSGGIGVPKPSKEKKGDLFARAMVFQQGKTRFAIVNVDNLGWTSVLGNKSRALIKGIAPENVLIGATHTHSAPDAYGFPDMTGKSNVDLKYLDWCVQQIADAVNEAFSPPRSKWPWMKPMEKLPIIIMLRRYMIHAVA